MPAKSLGVMPTRQKPLVFTRVPVTDSGQPLSIYSLVHIDRWNFVNTLSKDWCNPLYGFSENLSHCLHFFTGGYYNLFSWIGIRSVKRGCSRGSTTFPLSGWLCEAVVETKALLYRLIDVKLTCLNWQLQPSALLSITLHYFYQTCFSLFLSGSQACLSYCHDCQKDQPRSFCSCCWKNWSSLYSAHHPGNACFTVRRCSY